MAPLFLLAPLLFGVGAGVTARPPPTAEPGSRDLALAAVKFLRQPGVLTEIVGAMEARAVKRREEQLSDAETVLRFIPLLALVGVPLWLWRRGAVRRARAQGLPTKNVIWRAVVATLSVTALLFAFVQLFLARPAYRRIQYASRPAA